MKCKYAFLLFYYNFLFSYFSRDAKILAVNIGSALNSLLEFEELQIQHNQSNPCDN